MSTETAPETQLATRPAQPLREIRVVQSEVALFDTAKFEHMNRLSGAMAACALIPKHLMGIKNTAGQFEYFHADTIRANCLLIVNQAANWDQDPFAVAQKTYVIDGKLGYEGQLIAAVINTRSDIKGRLKHRFNSKQGDELAVVVYGSTGDIPADAAPLLVKLADEGDRSAMSDLEAMGVLAVRLDVKQAKTKNDIWNKDPEQKLIYSGVIRWARRFRPEVIQGVSSREELEEINDIPAAKGLELPPSTAPTATKAVETEVLPPAKQPRKAKADAPAETPKADPAPAPVAETKPEPAPVAETPVTPAQTETPAAATWVDDGTPSAENLVKKAEAAGFNEEIFLKMCIRANCCQPTVKSAAEISEKFRGMILEDWDTAVDNMKALAKEAKK